MEDMFSQQNLVRTKSKLFLFVSLLLVATLMFTACDQIGQQQPVEEPPIGAQEEPAVTEQEPLTEEEPVVTEEEPLAEEEPLTQEEQLTPATINEFGFYTVAELIGDDVLNAQMEDWGVIEDVIIGLEPNMTDYAVLELNDELFEVLEEDTVTLIPLHALSPSTEPEAFFLGENVSQDMLTRAPVFTEDTLADVSDPAWDDEISGFWETEGITQPEMAETQEMAETEQMAATTGPASIRASQLMGEAVTITSPEGDNIGVIENVVVSITPDATDYAILSFGGIADIADQDFVVPLNHLDFSQMAAGNIIFDADLAMLEQAPVFEPEAVTAPGVVTDPTWAERYGGFWGTEDVAAGTDLEQEGMVSEGFPMYTVAELIGDDVLNAQMEDWGVIEDVIIGLEPNMTDYVVLDLNDELFEVVEEGSMALIPLHALSPSTEPEAFFLDANITQDVFMRAPLFTEDTLADLSDPAWDDELFGFWETEGFAQPEMAETQEMAETEQMAAVTGPASVRASQLTGGNFNIFNTAGEEFGTIENIVVNVMPNTTDYAIMSFGGIAGLGDEQRAVPLSQLDFSQWAEGNVIVNTDQAMLQQAPTFNQEWVAAPGVITDPTWDDEIAGFWGVEDVAAGPGLEQEGVVGEETVAAFGFVKAAELIGDDVLNAQMEDWGIIEDVIVGLGQNPTHYALLDLNDELFPNLQVEGMTLIPVNTLSPSTEPEAFFLDANITPDMLMRAPLFDENALLDITDPTWDDEALTFWQTEGIISPDVAETEEMAATAGPAFVRLSELFGYDVMNMTQEDLGKVENVILGVAPNTTDYAIVSSGGFLDIGDEEFVVPLSQLDFTAVEDDAVFFDTTAETLETAPAFDETLFPDETIDETWDDEIASFWGIEETAQVE